MTRTEAYKVLEVAPGTTKDELKKAYRKLAFKHHPDKGGNTNDFQKINNAYSLLTSSGSTSSTNATGSNLTPEQKEILKQVLKEIALELLKQILTRKKHRPKKRTFIQRLFDWS
jgi:curved DNA-binding protein CbpA